MNNGADVVAIFGFMVDFLLILGASSMCGYPVRWNRAVLGAGLGGAYAFICMIPQCNFLGNILWRFGVALVICLVGFGVGPGSLRKYGIYVLLHLAVEGLVLGLGNGGALSAALGLVLLGALCMLAFRDEKRVKSVCVEICHGQNKLKLKALRDTGNMLKDPITGKPVLIIGADAAQKLTGLQKSHLERPVETLRDQVLPGLQLIPYATIGCPGGMLLAMRLQRVRIGNQKGSALVAFAPEGLGEDKPYQALLGGTI